MIIRKLVAAVAILTIALSTQARPRPAFPPFPEPTLLLARFDHEWLTLPQFSANVQYVDSWSATALQVMEGGYIAWVENSSKGLPCISPVEGSVRFWFAPAWKSGERNSKEPGVLTEVFATGRVTTPWLTVVVLPDGSGIGVMDANGNAIAGARIKWEAGKWHQIAVGYSAKQTVLYLDGERVAVGSPVPIPKAKVHGLTLGCSIEGDAQALGQYDDLTTHAHMLTDTDAFHNFRCYSGNAAKGVITPEEDEAIRQVRLAQRAEWEAQALLNPIIFEADGPIDYSGGPLHLTNLVYTVPGSGATNIVSMIIAGGEAGVLYDVFRAIYISDRLTNSWWVQAGQGYQGDTIYVTNEPTAMAFYIAASREDSDGDGLTDAYETLVVRTRPDQPPSVSISGPTNNATVAAPTNVLVTVVATNYLSPATLKLYVNGQLHSTQTGNPGTFTWNDPGVGSYALYATITDGVGAAATSAVTHVTVTLPALDALKCWLKADAITNANNTRLTYWADQSGNGNHATNSNISSQDGSAPVFRTNQISGYPAVVFTSRKLTLPGFLVSTQAEAFAVVRPNDGNKAGALWSFSTNTQPTYFYKSGVADAFGRQSPVAFSDTINGFQIYDVSTSSDEWVARINGSIRATAGNNIVRFDTTHVLGKSATAYAMLDIAEVLVFNQKLTEEQRLAVGSYLNQKYRINTNAVGAIGLSCKAVKPYENLLSWPAVTNATTYVLSRTGAGVSATLLTATAAVTNYTDTVLSDGPITYTLIAKNYSGSTNATVKTPLMDFISPAPEANYAITQIVPVNLSPHQDAPGGFGTVFTPAKVELFANGRLVFTRTNSPWAVNITNSVPARWNLQAKTYDTAGNSRYTAVVGVNVVTFLDSDGDGVSDEYDWFPFDPARWMETVPDPNDHTVPTITLTAP